MKHIPYFDILFVVICAGVLSFITYFGYSKLLSQFSVIIAIASYFIGKYAGRFELRRKLNEENNTGR